MTDYLDNIYIINLIDDVKKYESIVNNISKSSLLNNKYERFNAVNGKYLDLRLINDSIISDSARNDILIKRQKIYGTSLTYGSLGCALSHYLIYQQISKKSKPCIIFEDDIRLVNSFDKKFELLINNIKDIEYDICYIGYNRIPGFVTKEYNDVISKPTGLITGLYGYIVSPIGAQKILDYAFPLNYQIDSSISRNEHKFKLFCSKIPLVSVQTNFVSKTQKQASCENYCQIDTESNWSKLFKK